MSDSGMNSSLPSVLVLCHAPIGHRMAGTAIRYWEMARELACHLPTTLAIPTAFPSELQQQTQAKLVQFTSANLKQICRGHEVVVIQGFLLEQHPFLINSDHYLVADLYAPFHLESLENPQETELSQRLLRHANNLKALEWQMRRADLMLCASQRQRDFWLGMLASFGRVNPLTAPQGQYRDLIQVVPFGIPEQPKFPNKLLRKQFASQGVNQQDLVLLWGGGLWDWLDPLTPIKAVTELGQQGMPVKLVFMSGAAPNAGLPNMSMPQRALALAKDLGALQRWVFFHQEWVPYEQRIGWLSDADAGICAHGHHLETRFAFRTRMLDYFWAGLPVICSEGDSISDLVERYQVGQVCRYHDVHDWKSAIETLLKQKTSTGFQDNMRQLRGDFSWSNVLEPLKLYCKNPTHAKDYPMRWILQPDLVAAGWPLVRRLQRKSRHILYQSGKWFKKKS